MSDREENNQNDDSSIKSIEEDDQEGENSPKKEKDFHALMEDLSTLVGYQKGFPYNPKYEICPQTLYCVLYTLHERIKELEKHKSDE